MLKDIVSVDPLFGFTSNNYQVDPSISGQVCYDQYSKSFFVVDLITGTKSTLPSTVLQFVSSPVVQEMVNWFTKMQQEELAAAKNPAVKEAYDHYQLIKKMST